MHGAVRISIEHVRCVKVDGPTEVLKGCIMTFLVLEVVDIAELELQPKPQMPLFSDAKTGLNVFTLVSHP